MSDTTVQALATVGATVYFLVLDEDGQVWNGSTWESIEADHWASYAVPMASAGGSAIFEAQFPPAITTGQYAITAFAQSGGSPSASDAAIGYFYPARWSGAFVSNPAAPILIQGIVATLNSDVTLAGIVGTRIFPLVRPQTQALPAITYQILNGPRDHVLRGPSGRGSVGTALVRVRISAESRDYLQAKTISDAIRLDLDGFQGSLGGYVTVTSALLEDEDDDAIESGSGSDDWTYISNLEFEIRYREATS